jgi:hypothetical protein
MLAALTYTHDRPCRQLTHAERQEWLQWATLYCPERRLRGKRCAGSCAFFSGECMHPRNPVRVTRRWRA